jgi:hypothetical protein
MRPSAVALVLTAGAALLSGCAEAEPDPTAPPSTAAAADDCGTAATTVREHLKNAEVRTVTVNGQCTNVTIDTGLADGDVAAGRRLCETAAEVAYTGDINSVTVLSTSGAELSAGIPGMRCLP